MKPGMSRYSKTVVVSICYSIINGNRRIIEAHYPFERLTTDREAAHPNKLIKPFPYTTTMIMGMYEEMQNRTKTKDLYLCLFFMIIFTKYYIST